MEYNNEHERRMAVLEAALPYVNSNSRYAIQMMIQANSFINLAKNPAEADLSAYNLEASEFNDDQIPASPDPESMLLHIQEYLTPREADQIQTVLNFMHASRLFSNYREFVNDHAPEPNESDNLLHAASTNNPTQNNPLGMLFQLINGLGTFSNGFKSMGAGAAKSPDLNNNQLFQFLMTQMSSEQRATFEQLRNIMYN